MQQSPRKHCGNQAEWRIGLDTLREKCGSGSTAKELKRLVGKIIEDDSAHDHMPDYTFSFDDDLLVIRPKKQTVQPALPFAMSSLRIDPDTYGEARRLAAGWDIHRLEEEWRSWVLDKGIVVKEPNAHFLSFCRKRGPYSGH